MAGAEGTRERPTGRARSHGAIPAWGKESGFILFLKKTFIWLHWVFLAARGLFSFGM